MKKIIGIMFSLIMTVGTVGCGNGSGEISHQSQEAKVGTVSTAESKAEANSKEASSTEKSNNGKTLVVYYSATGSTKAVAETISKTLGADLFELVPENPYTSDDLDWTNRKSRVYTEYEDTSKRNVKLKATTVDNWSEYDTVFVGYPIWWGIAAWPVDNFVLTNKFSEKTVVPFCTSTSSRLGDSGKLLAKAAGTGKWLEGKRFPSSASEKEINEWVNSLNV